MILLLLAVLFNTGTTGLVIRKFEVSRAADSETYLMGHSLTGHGVVPRMQSDVGNLPRHNRRARTARTSPTAHSREGGGQHKVAGRGRTKRAQLNRTSSLWPKRTSSTSPDRTISTQRSRIKSIRHRATTAVPVPFQGKDPRHMLVDSVLGLVEDVYTLCRESAVFKTETLPELNFKELKKQFDPPVSLYRPYMTSLPVYFITAGASREPRFRAAFSSFSQSMTRIEAVFPDGSVEQVSHLIEDPRTVVKMSIASLGGEQWKKALGCLLSHLKAIRDAYRSGSYAAVILEDDALPYYPAWNSSLEEFLAMLPVTWEAVQLQWSAGTDATFDNKSGTGERPFMRGTSWGTTAYAIHRRGMERLLSKLWNRTTDKFTLLPLVRKCDKVSADDCLLAFTGFDATKQALHGVKWYPDPTDPDNENAAQLALSETFRAAPPLLLHGSFTTLMHVRNFCQDIVLLAQNRPRRKRRDSRVLLFLPAGTGQTPAAADQLRRTVTSLTSRGYMPFLAFGNANEEAMTASARKLKLFWQAWQRYGSSWTNSYDYIWAVDEDVDLGGVALPAAEREALAAGTALVAPTLDSPSPRWGDASRLLRWHHPGCRFRYTKYVDAVAPMLRPSAWAQIFREYGKLNGTGFQGIDDVWCTYLDSQRQNKARACALLERVTVSAPGVAQETDGPGHVRETAASALSRSELMSTECRP